MAQSVIAVDEMGKVYIADYGNNRIVTVGAREGAGCAEHWNPDPQLPYRCCCEQSREGLYRRYEEQPDCRNTNQVAEVWKHPCVSERT